MPITRRQFELEIDQKIEEWMRQIHSFLAGHRDQAFTEDELREQFAPAAAELLSDIEKKILDSQVARGTHFNAFGVSERLRRDFYLALVRLVELGAASKATIRGTEYYAYKNDLETVL